MKKFIYFICGFLTLSTFSCSKENSQILLKNHELGLETREGPLPFIKVVGKSGVEQAKNVMVGGFVDTMVLGFGKMILTQYVIISQVVLEEVVEL